MLPVPIRADFVTTIHIDARTGGLERVRETKRGLLLDIRGDHAVVSDEAGCVEVMPLDLVRVEYAILYEPWRPRAWSQPAPWWKRLFA